jgi:hypothetical protein
MTWSVARITVHLASLSFQTISNCLVVIFVAEMTDTSTLPKIIVKNGAICGP